MSTRPPSPGSLRDRLLRRQNRLPGSVPPLRLRHRRARSVQRTNPWRFWSYHWASWWNRLEVDLTWPGGIATTTTALLLLLANLTQPFSLALHFLWGACESAVVAGAFFALGAYHRHMTERARRISDVRLAEQQQAETAHQQRLERDARARS